MAKKTKEDPKAVIDELERRADEFVGQTPGSYSEEHRKLRANCIIDLATTQIQESVRKGRYTSTMSAWHTVAEACKFLGWLEGKTIGGDQPLHIPGLDISKLVIHTADSGTKKE